MDTVPAVPAPARERAPSSSGKKKKHMRMEDITCTFADRYDLLEQIGEGAKSQVKKCRDKRTGKLYAAKVVPLLSPGTRSRVFKELETLHLSKQCPFILPWVEFFEEEDRFYLIFEYMAGGNLLEHLTRRKTFTEGEARLVMLDVVRAVHFLHGKGIAHRDLKPDNILCASMDVAHPAFLCDFDLVGKQDISSSGASGCSVTTPLLSSPAGSACFMGPEVWAAVDDPGHVTYSKACDLWSLGVIIYLLLSGKVPFDGQCGRENCGWNSGGSCQRCQEILALEVQEGCYDYPDEEWSFISESAKDLIDRLLVIDPHYRITIDQVLKHPWISLAEHDAMRASSRPEITIASTETAQLPSADNEKQSADQKDLHSGEALESNNTTLNSLGNGTPLLTPQNVRKMKSQTAIALHSTLRTAPGLVQTMSEKNLDKIQLIGKEKESFLFPEKKLDKVASSEAVPKARSILHKA